MRKGPWLGDAAAVPRAKLQPAKGSIAVLTVLYWPERKRDGCGGSSASPGGICRRAGPTEPLERVWQHSDGARKRARAVPEGATLTPWGSMRLPRAALTACQGDTRPVDKRGFGLGIAAWGTAPCPGTGRAERCPCTIQTAKKPKPTPNWLLLPSSLLLPLLGTAKETFTASLGVKQEPCSQEREGLSLQEGKLHPRYKQSTRQEKRQQKLLETDCLEDKLQLHRSYLNPRRRKGI